MTPDVLPDRIRVGRAQAAAWGRVRQRLRKLLAEADPDGYPDGSGAVPDTHIFGAMLDICQTALKIEALPTPFLSNAPVYEAPPPNFRGETTKGALDLPAIIADLNTRIDRLERRLFWQQLKENPPSPGIQPIIPKPEWADETRLRFPEIYGRPNDG